MSAPGTIRTRDLGGRNALLCPLSYEGDVATLLVAGDNLDSLPPRMAAKVRIEDGCWVWTGALNSRGYASVGVNGRTQLGHRIAYELLVGPIGDGLTIDHLCLVKACVNPLHLEPVTRGENTRRKVKAATCPKGHDMTGDNARVRTRRDGHTERWCGACHNALKRAAYHRQRAVQLGAA